MWFIHAFISPWGHTPRWPTRSTDPDLELRAGLQRLDRPFCPGRIEEALDKTLTWCEMLPSRLLTGG